MSHQHALINLNLAIIPLQQKQRRIAELRQHLLIRDSNASLALATLHSAQFAWARKNLREAREQYLKNKPKHDYSVSQARRYECEMEKKEWRIEQLTSKIAKAEVRQKMMEKLIIEEYSLAKANALRKDALEAKLKELKQHQPAQPDESLRCKLAEILKEEGEMVRGPINAELLNSIELRLSAQICEGNKQIQELSRKADQLYMRYRVCVDRQQTPQNHQELTNLETSVAELRREIEQDKEWINQFDKAGMEMVEKEVDVKVAQLFQAHQRKIAKYKNVLNKIINAPWRNISEDLRMQMQEIMEQVKSLETHNAI